MTRDAQNKTALKNGDWNVLVVWECELKDLATLQARLLDYFNTLRVDGA